MVNFVSSLLVVAFAARVSATRQLSVDSLELEMMHLQSFAESHHTEEIHQILGHHHDEKPNRNEMLESVLQTGVFPKSKRGQDLTTDELVKDYIDKDYIYPKGRRKYGNIASPNTVGRSYSKEDKKKSVGVEHGTAVPSNFTDQNTSSSVSSSTPYSDLNNGKPRSCGIRRNEANKAQS